MKYNQLSKTSRRGENARNGCNADSIKADTSIVIQVIMVMLIIIVIIAIIIIDEK